MNPCSRRRQRAFKLLIRLPPLEEYAWDVVNSIEQTTIKVVDPYDRNAFDDITDATGAFLVDSDAKLTVDLEEWLAIGCQRIRWEHPAEDEVPKRAMGMFISNMHLALGGPDHDCEPLGPSIFVGEIVLRRQMQRAYLACNTPTEQSEFVQIFQFIVAHELVHVFDKLKYLVPAFLDWRAFSENILRQGSSADLVYSRLNNMTSFIDSYGEEGELESIRNWWPSRAEHWFKSRDLDWSILTRGEET